MRRVFTVLLLITVVISGCGKKVDKEAYTVSVKELSENIYDASVILGNYALYMSSYWNTLDKFNANAPGIKISFDPETAIEYADKWISDNSDQTRESMDQAHTNIISDYNNISIIESNDEFISETQDMIKDIYEEYCKLYSTATNPQWNST